MSALPKLKESPTADASALIQRAIELQPLLRERASETEKLGRVPDDTVEKFTEAGFFKMFQSAYWGVTNRTPPTFSRPGIVGAGMPVERLDHGRRRRAQLAARAFPEAGAGGRVGARPECASFFLLCAHRNGSGSRGRLRLQGRWYYSSGVDHVDWILLGGTSAEVRRFLIIARISFPRATSRSSKTGT